MPRRLLSGCCSVFLFLAFLSVAAQAQIPPAAAQKIDELVQAEMVRQKIPGLTVAIGTGDRIVYSKAFGMADIENSVPVKTSTVFRTASIAKPMTATAVMQLAEQGKLDLDAPIQKYCPAFPEKPWPVTARQLLGHLGGVRHYVRPGEASGTEHFYTLADSLRIFKDDPLLHEPGTRYYYSTFGYVLLGCAVEGASGMPYERYMAERVFAPAGMTRTRTDDHFTAIPDRTRGYVVLGEQLYNSLPASAKSNYTVGGVYNSTLHDTSMKIPGGGLVSTSEDLVRFLFALRAGKLVKPDTLAQMWTPQKTKEGQATTYGLGWGISTVEGGTLIQHTGGQSGTSTVVAYRADKGVVIAVMSNLQGAGVSRLAAQIAALLLSAAP